jgi:ubiquilin
MTDAAEGSADQQLNFKVKSGGTEGKQHSISISESATVLDLKTQLAQEAYENVAVERQRLIYSGRVMKNEDALSTYKIKNGNTVHLVKSAASNPAPPPAVPAPAAPAVPSNMAAGTAASSLADQITGARFAGRDVNLPSQRMFGPDGGMNFQPSAEHMEELMADPSFAAQLNEALSNPQLVDMSMYPRTLPIIGWRLVTVSTGWHWSLSRASELFFGDPGSSGFA